MKKQLKWDDYRQIAVTPHKRDNSGYQRPNPRYCHDYGPAKPEVVVTPQIKAVLAHLGDSYADGSAAAFAGRMAEAMGFKALAPNEAGSEAVDLRQADSVDPF